MRQTGGLFTDRVPPSGLAGWNVFSGFEPGGQAPDLRLRLPGCASDLPDF